MFITTKIILERMNLRYNKIGLIVPPYYNQSEAIEEFAHLCTESKYRVMIIVENIHQLNKFYKNLSYKLKGNFINKDKGDMIINLQFGGSIKLITYDNYINLDLGFTGVPDVLLVNFEKFDPSDKILEIEHFRFKKKIILIANKSVEYLSPYFDSYEYLISNSRVYFRTPPPPPQI